MSFQGFDIPEEVQMLRAVVRDFVAQEIRPTEDALGADATAIPYERVVKLWPKARQAGLWCLDALAEHGGAGLSAFEYVNVIEEAVKHKFSIPCPGGGVFGYSPPVVLYRAGADLIDRYVIPAIDQGWRTFVSISEPSGGSDPARSIRTRARRVGDTYVLNGRKLWATGADTAQYGVIFARTETGRGGITAFVVDADAPGMTITPVPVLRDHPTTEILLDDVSIPVANLVGEEGQGFALMEEFLVRGRLFYAAASVGMAEEALRMGAEWARERETFGAALATRQAVQFMIADSRVEINAGRWLTWEAAWKDDHGHDARYEASIAKLYCTEMGFRVVDRMMQVMGAMGTAKDLPLEHWFRNMRISRIAEGPSEIHRYLIARDILGPVATGKKA